MIDKLLRECANLHANIETLTAELNELRRVYPSAGAFKGVAWGRGKVQTTDGRIGYRVAVVGVVICDRPTILAESNETIFAGSCANLIGALESIGRGEVGYKFGDAGCVLTSLDDIKPRSGTS